MSFLPGGLAPGAVFAPPNKDVHPLSDSSSGRGYEQYSSSVHPTGLALVRPIPQQAAPFRVQFGLYYELQLTLNKLSKSKKYRTTCGFLPIYTTYSVHLIQCVLV